MVDSDDEMDDEALEASDTETDEYDELQDEGDAEYIIGIEQEPVNRLKAGDDDYVFEVLTAGEVVGLIQEIIRDVNTVVQVALNAVVYLFVCIAVIVMLHIYVFLCFLNS